MGREGGGSALIYFIKGSLKPGSQEKNALQWKVAFSITSLSLKIPHKQLASRPQERGASWEKGSSGAAGVAHSLGGTQSLTQAHPCSGNRVGGGWSVVYPHPSPGSGGLSIHQGLQPWVQLTPGLGMGSRSSEATQPAPGDRALLRPCLQASP